MVDESKDVGRTFRSKVNTVWKYLGDRTWVCLDSAGRDGCYTGEILTSSVHPMWIGSDWTELVPLEALVYEVRSEEARCETYPEL